MRRGWGVTSSSFLAAVLHRFPTPNFRAWSHPPTLHSELNERCGFLGFIDFFLMRLGQSAYPNRLDLEHEVRANAAKLPQRVFNLDDGHSPTAWLTLSSAPWQQRG
jgi:hypothetical protein